MKDIVKNKFAERLKDLRCENSLSRQQLADRLSVSVRLLSYWENGERECSFDMLMTLSNVLHCSIDYLLGNTEN